jgi:hypothetical protein
LYEGEPQTFADFAMECARAFGALATMRDDPTEAEVPDVFEPSPYYEENVTKAEARLRELEGWTLDQWREFETSRVAEETELHRKHSVEEGERRVRYEAMLAQAQAWVPPTDEHDGLREFMVDQIKSSIEFDCGDGSYPDPFERPVGVVRDTEIMHAKATLLRARGSRDDEIERCRTRTEWVRALRVSLDSSLTPA